jgi:carbohydrate-binding DOMON domain-containing protein
MASLGYNFLPSDAKISPSSIVRFQYDPTLIPPDVLETSLQIAYFDTVTNKWVSLPSEVDTNNHFVTAQISSFAFFAVTYGVINTEQVLITSTPTTPTTTTTQTTSTVTTTTSALTTTSSASTTTTKTMAVIPVSTLAGTTTTAAPRVVKMSLLAITIGIDAILIIGVVAAIVFIRRKLLKNG